MMLIAWLDHCVASSCMKVTENGFHLYTKMAFIKILLGLTQFQHNYFCLSVNKDPPHAPVLSQINPFHDVPSDLLNIHCSIILPSTPRPSMFSFSFRFFHQNPVCLSVLCCMCHMPHCLILFGLITVMVCSEDCKSLISLLFNFLHPRVTSSSILCINIFLSALFLNTLCVFLPEHDRPRFTPPSNRKNYIFV